MQTASRGGVGIDQDVAGVVPPISRESTDGRGDDNVPVPVQVPMRSLYGTVMLWWHALPLLQCQRCCSVAC